MKTRETRLQVYGIVLGLLALLLLTASAAQEDVLRKSFTFTDKGTLIIEADRGSIDVLPSTDGQISVAVFRKAKASSASKERQILDDHHVEFTQHGNKLRIVGKSPRDMSNWSSWFGRSQLEVRFEVHLPVNFDADLKTAGGNIKVQELTGKLELATSGGDLNLGSVNIVKGRTSGGSIHLGKSAGDVELSTSGGNIRAGKVQGNVSANTSGGHIEISFVGGESELRTSGGDIRVDQAGGSIRAGTTGGNVRVGSVTGKADLHTTGGNIEIAKAGGSIQAGTSGGNVRVGLTSALTDASEVRTTGGDIRVEVAGDTPFDLDARTTGGDVKAEVPVQVTEPNKGSVLRGQVNGGGKLLKLRTTGGNIRVQKSAG